MPDIKSAGRAGPSLLAAVFLLSASGLMFELTLTRIFSATIWYHYTFVAISVALFGWGLGGFLVCLLRLARFERQMTAILIVLSLLLAVTLPLFLCGILALGFTPDKLAWYFLVSLTPFLAGGAVLSLAFESRGEDSNRLYFADLIGAALGTLLVPLALSQIGAETTILAIALLPAAAAMLLAASSPNRKRWLPVTGVAFAAFVALGIWNHQTETLTVRDAPEKELYKLLDAHPGKARIHSDHWNAYSRITSVVGHDAKQVARLFIDSSAETSVIPWDGKPEFYPGAEGWFRAFPFRMKADPEVLIIGPGGGTDVVAAVCTGAAKVTAVEMNQLIVDAVRGFGAKAGNLYDHPKIDLVMEEGRNYIERTDRRFDVIVLGWVDSWASVASGGLALTENYLYTRDALEAYYDHLSDDGAVAIIRWPVDVRRLVANTVSFLSARGMSIEEIGRHIVAASIRKPTKTELSTVETIFLLSRSPLTKAKVDALLAGHKTVHIMQAPFREAAPPWADLFAGKITLEQYTESFDTLATPVSDDHPFYFAWAKPLGVPNFVIGLFPLPVGAVILFTLLMIVAGRLFGFRPPRPRTVAYFGALGMGFIIVEVALMQRLILLLGHPIYTLVVILFTLLLVGGVGSLVARRFAPARIHAVLGKIIPLVVVMVVVGAFALPAVVKAAMPLSITARILVVAALVFPYGFLMGMPFPLGLRHAALDPDGAPVSALWGINGVASVIGSIGGLTLAIVAGFTWTFMLGAACYVVAWLTRPRAG